MKLLQIDRVETPLGGITLVVDRIAVCALDFEGDEERLHHLLRRRYGALHTEQRSDPHEYSSRIRAYFDGDHSSIDTIAVDAGGTAFQRAVWSALRRIPPGSVLSYGQLAAVIGRPSAARTVGHTNALNPISLLIPCHRLVGARGSLRGYAGGLQRKQWLLRHEGAEPSMLQALRR